MRLHHTPIEPSDRKVKGKSFKAKLSEKASGHLMTVLIKQYQDEVAAAIREYASNARDANIKAGKSDVPIEVTLPTVDNPVLSIRDEGVGLDEDGLQTYVVFGESTKQDSDEETGAFGLGCKVGFVFGEFNVISVKDGVKYFTVVGADSSGELAIDILKTIDTNEPNGVEVRLPVGVGRVNETITKAYEFFKYWDKGSVLIDGVEPKNWLDDSAPGTYINSAFGDVAVVNNPNDVMVSMGNVAYPVNLRTLFSVYGYNSSYPTVESFGFQNDVKVILRAEIGELDITPSRDSLNYTKRTVDNIISTFKSLYSDVSEQLKEGLKDSADFSEAEEKIHIIKNLIKTSNETSRYYYDKRIVEDTEFPLTFRGRDYDPSIYGLQDSSIDLESLEDSLKAKLADEEIDKDTFNNEILKNKTKRDMTIIFGEASYKYAKTKNAKVSSFNVLKYSSGRKFDNLKNKRTIVVFDHTNGFDANAVRFSSYRIKLSEWMKKHDIEQVNLVAGRIDKSNPWIFDNKNVSIVDILDVEKEVKEIRRINRERAKELGLTVKKPRVVNETSYLFYEDSYYRNKDITISALLEKYDSVETLILVDKHSSYSEIEAVSAYLHHTGDDSKKLVNVKGNRSMNVFKKRVEESGLNLITDAEYVESVKETIVNDPEVIKHHQVNHYHRELWESNHLYGLTEALASKKTGVDLDRLSNLEVKGVNIGDLHDNVLKHYRKSTTSDNTLLAKLNFNKVFFKEEIAKSIKSLNLPTTEEITDDYPMLTFVHLRYNASGEYINKAIEYVELINNSKK